MILCVYIYTAQPKTSWLDLKVQSTVVFPKTIKNQSQESFQHSNNLAANSRRKAQRYIGGYKNFTSNVFKFSFLFKKQKISFYVLQLSTY